MRRMTSDPVPDPIRKFRSCNSLNVCTNSLFFGRVRSFWPGFPLSAVEQELVERPALPRSPLGVGAILERRFVPFGQTVVDDVEDTLLEMPFEAPYDLGFLRARAPVRLGKRANLSLRFSTPSEALIPIFLFKLV